MAPILFYSEKDPYYQFSNFYLAEITIDGIKYPSTEYYYQAQKFMGPDATPADLEYAKVIRSVNTSNKAYYLAKQIVRGGYSAGWYVSKTDQTLLNDIISQSKKNGVKPRSDWDFIKDNVMRKALWAKFTQHDELKELLVDTNDAYIAENSPRDSYWGLGNDGKGRNMLGRILMEIRTFLTANFPTAPTITSNWVVPEFLLASAYPGAPDINDHYQVVDALVNAPINLILSLQEAHEDENLNSYRTVIVPGFEPQSAGFCEKVWSDRYDREIIMARIPIKDRSVVSDQFLDAITNSLVKAVGKHHRVLIHCLGGKGRTGTVLAVMLGKMYGMTAKKALQVLAESFETRVSKGVKKSSMPQTKAQFAQVRRMLSTKPTPKYRLAIVGSRDFTDYDLFSKIVNDSLQKWNIKYTDLMHIVSGGAKGADTLAAQFASQHGIPLKEYLPDWDTYGKAAGPIRNKAIIADATHVIAFPSPTGSGTQNSIALAKKGNLPLVVHTLTKKVETASKSIPTVVCIKQEVLKEKGYKNFQDWLDKDPNHLYIGRNMAFYVPGAVASKWKNPFPVKEYTLEVSLEMYEQHVRDSPQLMAALPELAGKVLGCWCKGNACHGDVLVKLYKEVVLNANKPVQVLKNVRIGKKRSRGVAGEKNPVIAGFKNIDVTSGSANRIDGRSVKLDFSPLLIGPVSDGKMTAKKFENYWQYGKVFPDLKHVDAKGNPTPEWYAFREKGYAKEKADRHPVGTKSDEVAFVDAKGHNHYKYYKPAYGIYAGEKYDYITARKKVYVPIYAELISKTDSFKKLKQMVDAGQKIQIIDIDGPQDGDIDDLNSHTVTVKLLKDKINDPAAPFGHGYVVAALLAGIDAKEYT